MSNDNKVKLEDVVWEGSTPTLGFQIVSATGVGFKPTEVHLYLWDAMTRTLLRDDDVTADVDSNGNVAVKLEPGDTAMVTAGVPTEPKRALFTWSWNAGTLFDSYEIEFAVEANPFLPPA